MHACGHDAHTTCLIGAARILAKHAGELPGKVKFCFQPAEEGGAGGQRMVADGVLEHPKVNAAFAFHGWPDVHLGEVVSVSGPTLAAASAFDIEFTGRGGHAGYPHYAGDVLAAVAQFITNAQAIRTRFIDPLDPVVISFCQIEGGHAHNILPHSCHVKGTLRALSEAAQVKAKELLDVFLRSTAANFGIRAELRYDHDYPVLINNKACAALVADVARDLLGPEGVITDYPPGMGGEDFAYFAQRVPSTMYRVGLRPAGVNDYPGLHHPKFDFNDDAIPLAVRMFCGIADRFLRQGAAAAHD
jgi:amidohydrolase